jgi:hypothetical protein
MLKKIVPQRYNTHNCIENCIANYCDAIGVDFNPIFLYSWDFGYDKTQTTVGERLHYHYSCEMNFENYIRLSERYLNILFKPYRVDANELKLKCAVGSVFVVKMDSFDCPWNLAFQRYHYTHYYLLISNHAPSPKLVAIDSFSSLETISIYSDNLLYAKECYMLGYKQGENNEASLKQKMKNDLFQFISTNVENGVFDLIDQFNADLQFIQFIDDLSPQISDISSCFIIRELSYISNSRYNTASLISYLMLDDAWGVKFKFLHEKWESLKNYFIKIIISKKIGMLRQANEFISSIVQAETELAQEILKSGL